MSEGSASKLSELLEASRPELEAAVAEARRELRELDERRRELVSLIKRAQAALGEPGAVPARPPFEQPPPPRSFELDDVYERQVENLQTVKKGIADIVTVKKRLALRRQQLDEQGGEFVTQAREAMFAGREDLARAALERKQLSVQEAGSLDPQIAELESDQEKLVESEKQLRAKIEQFRSQRDAIKAKEVVKARYYEDLTALGPGEDAVDRQLDELGAKSAVDDEFARLKAEVQSGAPRAAHLADDTGTADDTVRHQLTDGDGEAALPG